jgi:ferrochelatase
MSFLPEPEYSHGKTSKVAVVLVNLGTPDAPTTKAVRKYLKEFLSDHRVVEIPRPIWWMILNLIILPFRSKKSAEKYASIWTSDGSPLKIYTEQQATYLKGYLGKMGHEVEVVYAMSYGSQNIPEVLTQLKNQGADKILILPAYPQYSATTTASVFDSVTKHYQQVRNVPELRFIKHYHDHPAYIQALRTSVLQHWEQHGRPEKLVMSFHGLPEAFLKRGDPYHCECYKTARLLAEQLGLSKEQYVVCFQSRLGRAKWLQPYTEPTVIQLAKDGTKRIDVICPGFTADCLETLEEIAMEVKQAFMVAGGKEFNYIPCLNSRTEWMQGLAEIAEQHLIGWPTMSTPSLKEERKQQALISRSEAKRIGADH